MMGRSYLRAWLRAKAVDSPRARDLYRRYFRPTGEEYARLLREAGHFHAMGENCSIQTNVVITDPQLVSLGSNVRMSGCTLFCHDGSVNMMNRALGTKFDSVGPIVIGDHVFIGHGALVLPGVRIGSYVIVAAGAVVTRDVPDRVVVAGVPARVVRSFDEHVEVTAARHATYPWRELVEQRTASYDPELEPILLQRRKAFFFGKPREEQEPRTTAAPRPMVLRRAPFG